VSQAPQLASVVQPLPVPWQECKTRAREVLQAEGYTGFLESGNGWIASARGTSASLNCIGRNRETVLVIVTAGGQLVKEATRLFERLRARTVPDSTAVPPGDTVPVSPELLASGCSTSPTSQTCSGWTSTAEVLGAKVGTRFNFWCPPNGSAAPVWGTQLYSNDSSVCTAAVHSGTLSLQAGGNAIIELRPGRPAYPASTRNGVSTGARGPASMSFVVIGRS